MQNYLALVEQEGALINKIKDVQEALINKVAIKYGKLSDEEIKTIVVEDKWIATLAIAIQGELDRVSQSLTWRIRELSERYASTLPQLVNDVERLLKITNGHLKKMGVT